MRNPKIVKIIIVGVKKDDEKQYFEGNIEQEQSVNFPLNQIGQSQGINKQRLTNYVQKKFPPVLKAQPILHFYHHKNKKFYSIQQMPKSKDIIILDLNFYAYKNTLLIRLSYIIDKYAMWQNKERISKLINNIYQQQNQLYDYAIKLEELNDQIQQMKENDNSQQKKYDVAILYSNPVCEEEYPSVDFNTEIQNFKQRMKELNMKFSYYITQATKENLTKVLSQNPKIIHITSHGQFNNEDYSTNLDFEKGINNEQAFTVDQLKQEDIVSIFQRSNKKQALIFFSCCHAGAIAQAVNTIGYNTISVNSFLRLPEKAANLYFEDFYRNVIQNENKQTLLQCHENAQKVVKDGFENDYQDCQSHEHTKECKESFIKNYIDKCIKIECCKSQEDRLFHKWDEQCQVKKQFDEQLKLKNEEKIDDFLMDRLEEVVKQEQKLKICCCEIAKIQKFPVVDIDGFKEYLNSKEFHIEHQASKTFEFKGDKQCKIFNFHKTGDQTYTNKIEWEQELRLPKHKDYNKDYEELREIVKKLLKKLRKIFLRDVRDVRKIITVKICPKEVKPEQIEMVIKFVEQIIKYFKQRQIEQSKLNDIRIVVLSDINKISEHQESEQIKYIFILFIKKINKVEWEEQNEYLLQSKIIIILINEQIEQINEQIKQNKTIKIGNEDLENLIELNNQTKDKQQQQN